MERGPRLAAPAHPHVHRHQRHPHRAQAADHARGRQGPGARCRGAGAGIHRRRRVLARGRLTLGRRIHGRSDPDRPPGGRHHDQRTRHRRLHDADRVPGDVRRALPAAARSPRRGRVGSLPRRPRARGRQLARRPGSGLPAGRVRDQRHRRARRQRVAGGDRDAAAHASSRASGCGPARTRPRSRARAAWSRA